MKHIFEDKGDYLFVEFNGEMTKENVKEFLDSIAPLIRESSNVKILSDFSNARVKGLGVKEAFNDFVKGNRPYVVKSAACGIVGLKAILAKMVIAISGRDDIKLFSSKDAGVLWLLED